MVVSRVRQAICVLACFVSAAQALEREGGGSIDWERGIQLAQRTRAAARVYTEPQVVYAGRPFPIKFEASGGDIQFPALPQIEGLTIDLRQRPSMSSQTSIINGRSSVRNEVLGYKATAPRPGKVTIPALEFIIDGKPVRAAAVEIAVKAPPPRGASAGGKPVREDYLFIRMVVDKTSVYQGEPVLLTLQLWMLDGWGAGYRTYRGTPRRQPATAGLCSTALDELGAVGQAKG